jgi:hypothetical protein
MQKVIPGEEAKKIESELTKQGFDFEIGYDIEGVIHILCSEEDENKIQDVIDGMGLQYRHFYSFGSFASDAIVEELKSDANHTGVAGDNGVLDTEIGELIVELKSEYEMLDEVKFAEHLYSYPQDYPNCSFDDVKGFAYENIDEYVKIFGSDVVDDLPVTCIEQPLLRPGGKL